MKALRQITFSIRRDSDRDRAQIFLSCRGSATVEFIALALPLFLPLFLFLNQYSVQSDLEGSLRTLSREMARAVVSSENDGVAIRVANELFIKGGRALGVGPQINSGKITFELHCASNPCISPDNEISVEIYAKELNHLISAVEYVSPWA